MDKSQLPAILICDCSSTEHQIVFHRKDDDGMVYATIHLTHCSFWRRLKKGIRYFFGYKCKYGHWDEFILSAEHAGKLREIANELENS